MKNNSNFFADKNGYSKANRRIMKNFSPADNVENKIVGSVI